MSGKARTGRGGKMRPDDGLLVGPAACMRVRSSGRVCDKCGDKPLVIHVPLRLRGQWCPSHCPMCNGAQNAAPSHGNTARLVRGGAGGGNVPGGKCSGV